MQAAYANEGDIRDMVAHMVSTYHPAGEHGCEEKGIVYEQLVGKAEEPALKAEKSAPEDGYVVNCPTAGMVS